MNDSDFANAYIQRLLHEVTERVKVQMMTDTHLELMSAQIAEAMKTKIDLEQRLQQAEAEIEILNARLEKRAKKIETSAF